ncbi:hypothetical protein [Nonlabens sp.]|uniref:hypothetical protein n=1 Tax=Nonlabens sp. TaxID=1888209 RepID=UPI0025D094A6|nr:hypothetical protein [Nonlabens sp.]
MSLEKHLNMDLRSRILEYSLFIESSINNLLIQNLLLFSDKRTTKLFRNNSKISFQNKVDLLDAIGVLSMEEYSDFELMMMIRNRLLRNMECDSFQTLFKQFDKRLVHRFKTLLLDGQQIFNEEACGVACVALFQKNIALIEDKISWNQAASHKKFDFFEIQIEQKIFYIDFINDLINEVSRATKDSQLEKQKEAVLVMELLQILEKGIHTLNIQSEIEMKSI